jgi:hypothetical protein
MIVGKPNREERLIVCVYFLLAFRVFRASIFDTKKRKGKGKRRKGSQYKQQRRKTENTRSFIL